LNKAHATLGFGGKGCFGKAILTSIKKSRKKSENLQESLKNLRKAGRPGIGKAKTEKCRRAAKTQEIQKKNRKPPRKLKKPEKSRKTWDWQEKVRKAQKNFKNDKKSRKTWKKHQKSSKSSKKVGKRA